jgi:hypothetical protein
LFGQTIQTGFAVVTPTSGTGSGLSVSGTFGELVGGNFFQASVIASPLVTLTNVVVNTNPVTAVNTGIALVNPNNSPATITMTLGNQQGLTTDSRTFTLGSHQQVAKFITEFFVGNSLLQAPLTGLVFISSNLPIGVLGLAFTGFSFASLPPPTQLTVANATVTNVVTANGAVVTPVVGIQPVFQPTVGVQQGIAAVSGTAVITPSSLVPSTINQLPSTFPSPTPVPVPTITAPIAGAPPVTAIVPLTGPLTGNSVAITNGTAVTTVPTTITTVPTTIQVVTPAAMAFPQINLNVGGVGAQLLPQVATGGGWLTQITIANMSGVTQTVRVDFFNPVGAPLTLSTGSTVDNVVIAPTGVATVSAPTL